MESCVLQLAAGSEHLMNGRTVRVNLAGPRPEQQQLSQEGPNQGDAALGQRSRQQGWPASPSGQPQFASKLSSHSLQLIMCKCKSTITFTGL